MVRRLVEAEQRGGSHQHLGQRDPCLLAARQDRDLLLHHVAREQERAQDRPQPRCPSSGAAASSSSRIVADAVSASSWCWA